MTLWMMPNLQKIVYLQDEDEADFLALLEDEKFWIGAQLNGQQFKLLNGKNFCVLKLDKFQNKYEL